MQYFKAERWFCKDTLCSLAPGLAKCWPSPIQGTWSSLEPFPLPSLQGHRAGESTQGCVSRAAMPSGSVRRKPLIFRALVAFTCG